nr:capsid protein [Bursera graveolens associated totivirus 1]
MDTFVRRFFNEFEAPGADMVYNNRLSTRTFIRAALTVKDDEVAQNRFFYSSQPMTTLGKMDANINTTLTSLDGLTRQYLTPEGTINTNMVGEELRQTSGMIPTNLQGHIQTMSHWNWADNHTTLLLNMLRFTFIRRMTSSVSNINTNLGTYNDGHVSINMDQFWGTEYPATFDFGREWPGGNADANYPDYVRLNESAPTYDYSAVDLRGLSAVQARYVLLMLGSWRRRSRLRADFATARLIDNVYYRSDMAIPSLDDWIVEENPRGPVAAAPEVIGWQQSWSALKTYVTQNRLYDHFSTALYLFCASFYQYEPVTAESVYWLALDWNLSLPKFSSIRGRYSFLNEGEAALVSHRALSEWGYISGSLEKINLMALTFSQAYLCGLAVRPIRRGLEDKPMDMFHSEVEFYNTASMISAAAAELIRGEVPLSGMTGVYIYCYEKFDEFDETRRIRIMETELGDEMDGYHIETRETDTGNVLEVVTPYLTFPGFPTLLVPLDPFPFNSPLSLSGRVTSDDLEICRNNARVLPREMWSLANIGRLCGYDSVVRISTDTVGPSEYFGPNDVSFVWPVLIDEGQTEEKIAFNGYDMRDAHFVDLPPIWTRFFRGKSFEYNIRVMQRGVSQTFAGDRRNIEEAGPPNTFVRDTTVTYNIPDGVKRLKGYISRDSSGFRFAGDVQGGVIPPGPEA